MVCMAAAFIYLYCNGRKDNRQYIGMMFSGAIIERVVPGDIAECSAGDPSWIICGGVECMCWSVFLLQTACMWLDLAL